MKLLEKTVYTLIIFLATYIILSLSLRLFDITSNRTSHMIGGIVATVFAVIVFILLLIQKKK